MFRRWKFTDPQGVLAEWVLPSNPNKMDAPSIEDTVEMGINFFSVSTQTPPKDWTFDGVLYYLADLTRFEQWIALGHAIYVTTHFGDQFAVQLKQIDAKRAGTTQHPERHTYTMRTLLLRQTARRTA